MARTRCPSCRRPVERGAETFPFCTQRCRAVDLGSWLGEAYRVPDAPAEELEGMALRRMLDGTNEDEWPSA